MGKIVRKSSVQPFLAILNLYQSFWGKLSEKFGMAIFGHSEFFFDNFSVYITLECNGLESNEICAFLGFEIVSIHITLIQCNGLESNENFFEKKLSEKTFFAKKNSLKKKQIWTKKSFKKFSEVQKFSQVQIFSEVHVKNNEFHI